MKLKETIELLNTPASGVGGETVAIYFIGIGGIGMSNLARYFKNKGAIVSGYDKTETALTKQLAEEGIKVHYEDNVEFIDRQAKLVVYTPAIPKDHKELGYYQEREYTVIKRADVLGAIVNSSFNICVAGTHGKTTTSSMIAHILRHSGFGCTAFLGGIAANYNSNFWANEKNVCVVEADEYDRSFLKLSPDVAIITAMDPDHLDIYGTEEAMQEAFIDFSKKIKTGGVLLSKHGLTRANELQAPNHIQYAVENDHADVYATNIRMNNGCYVLDINLKTEVIADVKLNMGGMHNIENVTAAIAVAHHLKIDQEKIKAAVQDFRGVKRRFEYIIPPSSEMDGQHELVFVDDYAHHPEELRALITGARKLFEYKRCTVIFQPHLFSRTKDLADGFAEVLDMADEVLLLPVYPARELPMEGISSQIILDRMKIENKRIISKEQLLDHIKTSRLELLITAGAGDIDTIVQPIKEILTVTK